MLLIDTHTRSSVLVCVSDAGAVAVTKYEPLTKYLKAKDQSYISVQFSEIEALLGMSLPRSAYAHRAWWSNNPNNNVMTKAWLAAGYRTEQVDLERRRLVFRRAAKTEAAAAPMTGSIPLRSGHHPLLGSLKGTVRIEADFDLTQPADPGWGEEPV
jgi:hypothetical protein